MARFAHACKIVYVKEQVKVAFVWLQVVYDSAVLVCASTLQECTTAFVLALEAVTQ
jgi:hypothetical protein